jgi:hypothetical protein
MLLNAVGNARMQEVLRSQRDELFAILDHNLMVGIENLNVTIMRDPGLGTTFSQGIYYAHTVK